MQVESLNNQMVRPALTLTKPRIWPRMAISFSSVPSPITDETLSVIVASAVGVRTGTKSDREFTAVNSPLVSGVGDDEGGKLELVGGGELEQDTLEEKLFR